MDGSEPSDVIADILSHHGVKGMKWGSRKSGIARADKKFEGGRAKYNTTLALHSTVSASFTKTAEYKNLQDKYGKKLTNDDFAANKAVYKEYRNASRQLFMKQLNDASKNLATNASGTRKYVVKEHPKNNKRWVLETAAVSHADANVEFDLSLNSKGMITSIKPVEALAQSAMTATEFLAHYGVAGMKWGKRKNPASADSAKSTTVKTAAKKQGLHTVSNKDLQEAITRMNLEQNFKRLKVNDQSAATRWISSTLLEVGKREVQSQIAKKVGGTILKKAATGGAG